MPIIHKFVPGNNGTSNLRVEYEPYNEYNRLKSPVPPPPGKGLVGKILKAGKKLLLKAGKGVKAVGKFLGAASVGAIAKLGLATAAFWALMQEPVADGTLPEHLRDPGEQQVVDERQPDWYGGQNAGTIYRLKYGINPQTVNGVVQWQIYYSGQPAQVTSPIGEVGIYQQFSNAYLGEYEWKGEAQRIYVVVVDASGTGKFWVSQHSWGLKIFGFEPTDGSTEDNSPIQTKSEPTTNHKNIPPPEKLTAVVDGVEYGFDKSVRFVRDGAPVTIKQRNFSPSSSVPKSKTSTPTVKSPSSTPEAIPTPEPEPEKTIEEQEQKQQESKARRENYEYINLDKDVIEVFVRRKGNGGFEIVRRKKLSQEQLRDIQQRQQPTEEDKGWYKIKNNPFLESVDPRIQQQVDALPDLETEDGTVTERKISKSVPGVATKIPSLVPEIEPNKDKRITTAPPEPDKPEDPTTETEDGMTPFIPPPPVQNKPPECKGCSKKILDKLDGLSLGAQGLDLALVREIHATVHSGTHGLAKIQNYAETAWKATRADKIMNAVNNVLIVHNAMMLSNNILGTTSEVLNLGLETLGVRDEEDKPIDLGATVRNIVTNLLKKSFGQEKYAKLTAKIASFNRIYQSGANIAYNIRNMFDAGQDIAETTAEHVSFIGNALRRDGVVRENSYRLMPTDFQSSSRLLYRLERANDALDLIEDVSQNARDIKEEINEMRDNHETFVEELEKITEDQSDSESSAKVSVVAFPQPSEKDEQRGVEDGEE